MQTDLTFIMGHIMAAQHKVDALESLIRNECGYSQDNLLKQIAKQAHALANHAVTIQTLANHSTAIGVLAEEAERRSNQRTEDDKE